MYIYKGGIDFPNQRQASDIIGLDQSTLCRILAKKQRCRKVVAYCITKAFNENAKITDYFTQIQ